MLAHSGLILAGSLALVRAELHRRPYAARDRPDAGPAVLGGLRSSGQGTRIAAYLVLVPGY
jgi:hypothetical protein